MLVGNTPLLALEFTVGGGEPRRLYAKAENVNMTGSIKDRMALHILRSARDSGLLQPGGLIVEATGSVGVRLLEVGNDDFVDAGG